MLSGVTVWEIALSREMDRPCILVVEDDAFVQSLLSAVLENEGFATSRAGSAGETLAEIDHKSPSAILLDLGLPDEEGISLLRKIRARTNSPVMVVTASESLDERISALELGAEDFVIKPVEPRELVLRLRRLLRPVSPDRVLKIEFQGWQLDEQSRTLKSPDGREVALRRAEFNLLTALFKAPRRVFSRDQLLDSISAGADAPTDRTVDVLVSRIRKKLGPDGRGLIGTVTGVGYTLRA